MPRISPFCWPLPAPGFPALAFELELPRAVITPLNPPAAAIADRHKLPTLGDMIPVGTSRTSADAPAQATMKSNSHAAARDSHSRSSSCNILLVSPTNTANASPKDSSNKGDATVMWSGHAIIQWIRSQAQDAVLTPVSTRARVIAGSNRGLARILLGKHAI